MGDCGSCNCASTATYCCLLVSSSESATVATGSLHFCNSFASPLAVLPEPVEESRLSATAADSAAVPETMDPPSPSVVWVKHPVNRSGVRTITTGTSGRKGLTSVPPIISSSPLEGLESFGFPRAGTQRSRWRARRGQCPAAIARLRMGVEAAPGTSTGGPYGVGIWVRANATDPAGPGGGYCPAAFGSTEPARAFSRCASSARTKKPTGWYWRHNLPNRRRAQS